MITGMVSKNTLLEDIAAEIGYTATSTLCGWFGGRYVFVPATPSPEHKIAKVIGVPAFSRLSRSFGGETLFIPKDQAQRRARRHRIVFDMLLRGDNSTHIGGRVNISNMQVRNIRRILEADGLLPMILTTPVERNGAD